MMEEIGTFLMINDLVWMNGLHLNPILLSRSCHFMRKETPFSMMPVRFAVIWRVSCFFLVRHLPTKFVEIMPHNLLVAAQTQLFGLYLDPAFADARSKFKKLNKSNLSSSLKISMKAFVPVISFG